MDKIIAPLLGEQYVKKIDSFVGETTNPWQSKLVALGQSLDFQLTDHILFDLPAQQLYYYSSKQTHIRLIKRYQSDISFLDLCSVIQQFHDIISKYGWPLFDWLLPTTIIHDVDCSYPGVQGFRKQVLHTLCHNFELTIDTEADPHCSDVIGWLMEDGQGLALRYASNTFAALQRIVNHPTALDQIEITLELREGQVYIAYCILQSCKQMLLVKLSEQEPALVRTLLKTILNKLSTVIKKQPTYMDSNKLVQIIQVLKDKDLPYINLSTTDELELVHRLLIKNEVPPVIPDVAVINLYAGLYLTYWQNDAANGEKYLLKAKMRYNIHSYYFLAKIKQSQRLINEMLEYYQLAMNEQIPEAYYDLALYYVEAKDVKKAIDLLQKAAELGHVPSMYDLGSIYRSTENKDKAKVQKYLMAAAAEGHAQAADQLATLLVADKELDLAKQYYQQAIQAGYLPAVEHMLNFYEEIKDVEGYKTWLDIFRKVQKLIKQPDLQSYLKTVKL